MSNHEVMLGVAVESQPDFDLIVDPWSGLVKVGESLTFAVSILSIYGFAGRVRLEAVGVPEWGVTAAFTAEEIGVEETSTLTVSVPAGAPALGFNISVRGALVA